jgi:hypothetical protein
MRLLSLLAFALLLASPVRAAELVMFEQKGCVWCAKFDREVAPAYGKTDEGRRAPLRRIDIATPLPPDLAFVRPERFTPVFVLVDKGREYGRIRGYPGDAFFWGLLANMLERLDRGEPATPDLPAAPPPGATFAE